MPFLNDAVLDAGLAALLDATVLHICTDEPANYAGLAAVTLGNKTSPTITAASDGSPNGRQRTVAAFTGGTVTGTGTADCWALVDVPGTRILASGTLTSGGQVVTSGNTFSLTSAIAIRIPDAA
jgi:hypothetical protein